MPSEMQEKKVRWKDPDGDAVSCTEKIMVLEENFEEIKELLQNAIDDAILMGCSEKSFKTVYRNLIENLKSEYPEKGPAGKANA